MTRFACPPDVEVLRPICRRAARRAPPSPLCIRRAGGGLESNPGPPFSRTFCTRGKSSEHTSQLEFEVGGTAAYLFHQVTGSVDRVMDSSSWTQFIRKLTLKWTGTAVAPKTLRSIFITWLRENTDAPEILKSAARALPRTQRAPRHLT